MRGIFTISVRDGKRTWNDLNLYRDYIEHLQDGEYMVTIKKKRKPKSLEQNGYYWATLTMVAMETGIEDPDAIHEEFKRRFNPIRCGNITVGGSTKNMTTLEMSQYMDKVIRFIEDPIDGLGIRVPDPTEFYTLIN